ncbi:MAG: DUF397 domain-containing protein [Pseudonocardiaceae bacterium]
MKIPAQVPQSGTGQRVSSLEWCPVDTLRITKVGLGRSSRFTCVRAVRDSENPTGPILIMPVPEWSAFTSAVRSGEFG